MTQPLLFDPEPPAITEPSHANESPVQPRPPDKAADHARAEVGEVGADSPGDSGHPGATLHRGPRPLPDVAGQTAGDGLVGQPGRGLTTNGVAGALLDGASPEGLPLNGGISPEDAAAAIEATRAALRADEKKRKKRRRLPP